MEHSSGQRGTGRLARHAAGAALLALAGTVALAATRHRYAEIPADFLRTIEAAEAAFNRRDAEGVGRYLADDYAWNQVTVDGAREVVRGRAQTVGLIGRFFGADTWVKSDFERLGMVGNILVQVEEDTVLVDGQPVKKVTLNLYEFRNGQRWREWKFFPSGEGPEGNMPPGAK